MSLSYCRFSRELVFFNVYLSLSVVTFPDTVVVVYLAVFFKSRYHISIGLCLAYQDLNAMAQRLKILLFAVISFSIAQVTAYPEVIPGDGFPSLAKLNLTSAQLYAMPIPEPSKNYS